MLEGEKLEKICEVRIRDCKEVAVTIDNGLPAEVVSSVTPATLPSAPYEIENVLKLQFKLVDEAWSFKLLINFGLIFIVTLNEAHHIIVKYLHVLLFIEDSIYMKYIHR